MYFNTVRSVVFAANFLECSDIFAGDSVGFHPIREDEACNRSNYQSRYIAGHSLFPILMSIKTCSDFNKTPLYRQPPAKELLLPVATAPPQSIGSPTLPTGRPLTKTLLLPEASLPI